MYNSLWIFINFGLANIKNTKKQANKSVTLYTKSKIDHPNLKVSLEGNEFIINPKTGRHNSTGSELKSQSKDIQKQTPKSKQLGKFLKKYAPKVSKVVRISHKRSESKNTELTSRQANQ